MPKTRAAVGTKTETAETVATLASLDAGLRFTVECAVEAYQQACKERNAAQETMDLACAEVKAVLAEAGIKKLRAGEVPISLVEGTTSKLDKLKFVELGGSLEMLENATVTKPKKAYVVIGGERKRKGEDDAE